MAVRGSITPELWARSFDNLRAVEGIGDAIEQCRRLARGEITWLLLHGQTGTGKTHLAVATAKYYDSLHVIRVADTLVFDAKIQWWSVPLLLEAETASWTNDTDSPLVACRDADLLVLDDLGMERPVEQFHGRLLALLELRYAKRKLTLATTNLSTTEFIQRYGERLQSRFLELGSVIHIQAPDYRATGDLQELPPEPIVDEIVPDFGEPVDLQTFLKEHSQELNGAGMRFLRLLAERKGVSAALDQIKKARVSATVRGDEDALKRIVAKEKVFLAWIKGRNDAS